MRSPRSRIRVKFSIDSWTTFWWDLLRPAWSQDRFHNRWTGRDAWRTWA